jgi:hypothetical protein
MQNLINLAANWLWDTRTERLYFPTVLLCQTSASNISTSQRMHYNGDCSLLHLLSHYINAQSIRTPHFHLGNPYYLASILPAPADITARNSIATQMLIFARHRSIS